MPAKKSPIPGTTTSNGCQLISHRLTVTTATAIEPFLKRVLHRNRAGIQKMCSGGTSPGTHTTCSSPAMRLPHEIIEIIFTYFASDFRTLWSCSLTCYSWYIAAVPRINPILTIIVDPRGQKLWHRDFIQDTQKLGSLPLVKFLQIRSNSEGFSPKRFNYSIPRKFLKPNHIQRLEIDNLDIPSFMSKIPRYFGPFLPTLRALYLKAPKGSNRQIIFFVGSFPYLQDLSLQCCRSYKKKPKEDLRLVPPFTPPLQGRLMVRDWTKEGLFQEMVRLFGGIGFRVMSLFNVVEMQFLLRTCARTLRLVEFPHPTSVFQLGKRL